ncbi:MAG: DUF58 domain-containing protein [Candidatus Nealsonbacteria bacterium]|nr:DUF58 domain-containing protein [Candidatus Nealsonbacteria bacterium]
MREIQSRYLKRRRLKFTALLRVLNLFPGEFPSIYKGEGEDFVDLRPYQSGDNAKRIHWPQYAKARELFVIERVVQKNLTIIVALDLSNSMSWSEEKLAVVDTFLEILIGSLVLTGNNSFGFVGFSSGIEGYFPPRLGRIHFRRILRWHMEYQPKNSMTNIPAAMRFISRATKPKSVIFFISDFFEKREFEKEIKIASQKFDFIPVVIKDPKEFAVFSGTRIAYKDVETGKKATLWLTAKKAKEITIEEEAWMAKLKDLFKRHRLYSIFLDSAAEKDVAIAVHDFFKKRIVARKKG